MGSRAYFIMLLITQLMKEILNNDSESPKLNVDVLTNNEEVVNGTDSLIT